MSTRRVRTTARRCLLPPLVLIFMMGMPSAAEALPSPCSILPAPSSTICSAVVPGSTDIPGIPGVPNPVSTVVHHAVGTAANAFVEPVVHEVTKMAATAMTAILKAIFSAVSNATEPEITAAWFINLYELLGGLALVVGVGFLIPSLHGGVKEGDLEEVGTSAAIFGGFIVLLLMLPGLVGVVLWVVDQHIVPFMTNMALGDLNHVMANHHIDFTKDSTLGNNAVTPILVPFVGSIIGFIGGFFTLILFEVRNVMVFFLVGAEALAAAMAVGRRWGNDTFVRVTMALLAWVLLRFIMAIVLIIAVKMVVSPNKSAIITGAIALATMPILGWVFVKFLANHRIQVLGSALNANAMWHALPFTS
jgi:hypothetical protein